MLGIVVVFLVATLTWERVSDDRQTAVNHKQADRQITAMTAFFAQQLDTQGQRSALTDADLSTAAQNTQTRHFSGGSGVKAQGLQVLAPVTRDKDLTFDIRVMTVYVESGLFASGDIEDYRCFRVQVPERGGVFGASTVAAIPTCPALEPLQVP